MTEAPRIELTVRFWATSSPRFEEYLEALVQLLPRHQGNLVRRVEPLDRRPGEPDVVLVMSFPNAVAIDSFLRDPARSDIEDLAEEAVVRSLISDGRTRTEPHEPATLHELRRNDG
ncbi:MAG: DUF1330 domain-containing protein [Acidimicrobiales bacterium]|nr:DUF1330 domain-containing protein [Acidimicrobiales bacterium]